MIERIYTLLYYRLQIGSMNYYPLFRVRSWDNGVRCMSLYSYMYVCMFAHIKDFDLMRLCLCFVLAYLQTRCHPPDSSDIHGGTIHGNNIVPGAHTGPCTTLASVHGSGSRVRPCCRYKQWNTNHRWDLVPVAAQHSWDETRMVGSWGWCTWLPFQGFFFCKTVCDRFICHPTLHTQY